MKKKILALGLATALSLLAGCGNGGTTATPTPGQSGGEPSKQPAAETTIFIID